MRNKTQIAKMKKDYIKIPLKIRDMDISSDAYKLYGYFCSLPENSNPGISGIMSHLKLSRNTAYNALNELENRNMIRMIIDSGINRRAIYELTPPSVWK